MALIDYTTTLKGRLNAADQNQLGALLQVVKFGDFIRRSRCSLRHVAPAAAAVNKYVPAVPFSISLPEDAKALTLTRVWARVGSGTAGLLSVDADADSEPADGHVKISGSGDILFNAANAWTSVDVDYAVEEGDVIEVVMSATAADTFTFPTVLGTKVLRLIEAESLAGTLTGKMIILVPAAAKPATTKASLVLAKSAVQFAVADAVTQARLKLVVASSTDLNTLLEAQATF